MKIFKQFPYLFILIGLIISCKKDIAIQSTGSAPLPAYTPAPYFPAFAGSWWQYRKTDGSFKRFEMLKDYSEYNGKNLPYHVNMNLYVDGANFLMTVYYTQERISSPIYSQKKDSSMICPIAFSKKAIYGNNSPIRRTAISTDTSLMVFDNYFQHVIVMKETSVLDPSYRYFDYLAKNVGLIRRDSINANDTTDLIPLLRIESFYIGN